MKSLVQLHKNAEWNGDVDACERNCGETALEFDWFRSSGSLLSTFLNNLNEPRRDVLEGHFHHEGMDVNFLHRKEAKKIGEAVKGA